MTRPKDNYLGPDDFEWYYVWFPMFLNMLALCFYSCCRNSYQRINFLRQLRQVGTRVCGVVQRSRMVEQSQHDGHIQNLYYLTVKFPVYFQMPDGEQNFSAAETTEGVNEQGDEPRRIHGWAIKEYNVTSDVFMTAIRTREIEMVFDPSVAPNGLAAPAYLVDMPDTVESLWYITWNILPLVGAILLFSILGATNLPHCAPLHTGPCTPYWLVGYFGPILFMMIFCTWCCFPHYVDLQFELWELNDDAV